MRNIILLCTILLVVIAVLAGKYFSELSGKDENVTKVLYFIPSDAALVLNFRNDESFYDIFKDYEIFNAIIGKNRSAEIVKLKQLLLQQDKLSEITADKNFFLSFHPTTDSVEFLYSINLDKTHSTSDLQDLITEIKDFSVKPFENFYQVESGELTRPFYIFMEEGVAIASFSNNLIKRCINQKKSSVNQSFIQEIGKTSSKNLNSPINLFINHQAMPDYLQQFFSGKLNGNSALLNKLQGVSSLSMNFKSDALMFNGISNTDTSKPHYLNIFLHQKPVPNQIKKVLPENTSNFIAFGLSDVKRFHNDLKIYFDKKGVLKDLENELKLIQTKTGVNPDRDIKPFFEKEFVTIQNSYREKFVIIKVSNGRNINFKLQLISTALNEQISKINHSDLFYYYFGDPLKSFSKPYFAVVDNYLILANTPGIISNFISAYQKELFLSNREGFKQYDQLVANQSNILFFTSIENSKRIIRSTLKPNYSKPFNNEGFGLKNFYGLSFQWTGEKDHFFANLYLSYNSSDSISLYR